MQSTVTTVDQYINEADPGRQPALRALREMILKELAPCEERMEYGMPVYYHKGQDGGVAFASQKQYISLYITKLQVLNAHRHLLPGLNVGKSCIRYPSPARINWDVVRTLLQATAASDEAPC